MQKDQKKKSSQLFSRLGIVLFLLILWELLPRLSVIPPIILAPISSVFQAAITEYTKILVNLKVTAIEIAIAIAIAWGFGLVLGVFIGSNRTVCDVFLPLISSVYAIPIVVIYPLLAAWFGLVIQSKYLFGGVYGLFPVVLNTIAGIRGVEARFIFLAKSIGASRVQTVIKIIVPLSLPGILPGIRLGAALAVIGVVVAEMLASAAGIGFLIEYNRTIFKTAHVYMAILVVIGIVAAIDRILFYIEKKLIYWN
jgi:NitT/TauT family transport system permease protein/taurine transport system permease protein